MTVAYRQAPRPNWYQVRASAPLERLLHHAVVIAFTAPSYRIKERLSASKAAVSASCGAQTNDIA